MVNITRAYHDPEADRPDSAVTLDEGNPSTSRIVLHDKRSEDQELPAPETSTAGVVVGGTEDENDITSECFRSLPSQLMFMRVSIPPPSEESTGGGTRKEEGGSMLALRGTRRYHCVVRSLLTSTSPGDRQWRHRA
jgi:hypothetical protein